MATPITIDLDGFGFLDSDIPKLSPTMTTAKTILKQPISPIESESSSGISSLDSDDLKVFEIIFKLQSSKKKKLS